MELETKISSDTAVYIRGAYKRFLPTQIVLNGLNLTIKERTMYVYFSSKSFNFAYF